MDVKLINERGFLRLEYSSKYASGSVGIHTPKDLVLEIENICGKGSYCLYQGKGETYPKAIDYFISKDLVFPTITYWQQGVKTEVIEQCRAVAIQVFGNIPEMEIGWLENQCQSYIEDIMPEEQLDLKNESELNALENQSPEQ